MKASGVAVLLTGLAACAPKASLPSPGKALGSDGLLLAAERRYTVELLRRNPTMSTYLGGAGIDPSLEEADGRLREVTPQALEAEDHWLETTATELQGIQGASASNLLVDREVALAQIRFVLRQHRVRRYQERALDTYVDDPFRSLDWQLQGMSAEGTPAEWERVAARVADVPRYLGTVRAQLAAGARSANFPDGRMLVRHGLDATAANATYFAQTFPELVEKRLPLPAAEALRRKIKEASLRAAQAYRELRAFLVTTFFDDPAKGVEGLKPLFRGDRYALGEVEYDWALRNNLRIQTPSARLYDEAWPVVQQTREAMVALARQIGARRHLALPPEGPEAVRWVREALSKDHPRSDAELLDGYREAVRRLVDYGRRTHLFEIPADYQLEVRETPLPLRASLSSAGYYPAPAFKTTGVGRYYVTPTENDPAALAASNYSSMADLSAHEGFPGHDWQYKMMARFRDSIGWVRWLTPGAVEDSSSMWGDSMLAEGWGLYAEALMAEPRPGAPDGFYTPEERLYQLSGQLVRDVRVRVDIGLHLGKLSYAEAVNLVSEVNHFLPGSCVPLMKGASAAKKNSCLSAEESIYRYSSSPTQAITYRLGKEALLALRAEASSALGAKFSLDRFHLEVMRQGTLPVPYFREELLRSLRLGSEPVSQRP